MVTGRELIIARGRDRLLAVVPNAVAIYVYGSFASGNEWPNGDLDLAVPLRPEHEIPELLSTIGRLSVSTGRTVDLVDLQQAGGGFGQDRTPSDATLLNSVKPR
jgi:predicted nucleotidyltransferase